MRRRQRGWETGKKEKERTGAYITSGKWVILRRKSSSKQEGDLLSSLYYAKAAFGCGFA
jgi:hypothetical protein